MTAQNSTKDIARYIDHTLLKPEAIEMQVRELCREAKEYGFATVCVNPSWVKISSEELKGSRTGVCTVAGFPLGATPTEVKVFEACRAIADGASEIDMVINIGLLKSRSDSSVFREIRSIAEAVHERRAILKVIIETALLTKDEKIRASVLAKDGGADYVKTSTGFGPSGATVEDIALMRQTVGPNLGVKAAGGIRDLATVHSMIAAGATRIGASAGVRIMREWRAAGGR